MVDEIVADFQVDVFIRGPRRPHDPAAGAACAPPRADRVDARARGGAGCRGRGPTGTRARVPNAGARKRSRPSAPGGVVRASLGPSHEAPLKVSGGRVARLSRSGPLGGVQCYDASGPRSSCVRRAVRARLAVRRPKRIGGADQDRPRGAADRLAVLERPRHAARRAARCPSGQAARRCARAADQDREGRRQGRQARAKRSRAGSSGRTWRP